MLVIGGLEARARVNSVGGSRVLILTIAEKTYSYEEFLGAGLSGWGIVRLGIIRVEAFLGNS